MAAEIAEASPAARGRKREDTTMTIAASELSPVGVLIVAWLLTRPQGKGSKSDLKKALEPFLGRQQSASEQERALEAELQALTSGARLKQTVHGKKRQSVSLSVTEEGRRAGLRVLKVKKLPTTYGWRGIKRYLLTPAIGFPPPLPETSGKGTHEADKVRAAILARAYLPGVDASPTRTEAIDAVVAHELGLDPREPLMDGIRTLFLNRALGTTKPLKLEAAFQQLAAKLVGAHKADAGEIQLTVISRWLSGSAIAPAAKPRGDTVTAPSAPKAVPPLDDEAFAARVLEAARASKTGRFGERKVFISHVFQALVRAGAVADDADAFKARLVSAHRGGQLSLSRADLVEAMEPEDVEASETRYLSASFHFIGI